LNVRIRDQAFDLESSNGSAIVTGIEQQETPKRPEPILVHATLVQQPEFEEPPIDLGLIWRFFTRHLILMVACSIVVGAAAVWYSYTVTKIYRAEVTLEPVASGDNSAGLSGLASRLGGVAGLLGVDFGSVGNSTEASLALLRSRQLGTQFILENDLMPRLFADRWDAARKQWAVGEAEVPTLQDAFDLFSKGILSVREDRKTGLVILGVDWKDRQEAATWANAIVDKANGYMAQQAVDETDRSIKYLNAELARTDEVGLRQAIYSLIEVEIKKRMLARTRADYAFRVLDAAVPPQVWKRVKPNRVLYLLAGLILGGGLGIAIGLSLDRRGARRRLAP
jgi:uncharacterized protein involved in exopolysaccharide biosynthesis